jgi:transcriptional regulator with XRE-family HTH domain
MYRNRLEEIIKEKGYTIKKLSAESGVSSDTISRIIKPENPDKDSPRVNTLEDLCKVLGIEVWELFYMGDRSLVSLQAEINELRAERDTLLADNAVLKDRVCVLTEKVDTLKDELIDTLKFKLKSNT